MLYLEGSLLQYMYTAHTNTIEDYQVTNPCTVIGQRYRTLSALANYMYMYMYMHDQSRTCICRLKQGNIVSILHTVPSSEVF